MKHRRWFLALMTVAAAGMPAAAQYNEASDLPVWSRWLAERRLIHRAQHSHGRGRS